MDVFGCFCSYNCAAAYNLNMNDYNIWNRYSLLKKMYEPFFDDLDIGYICGESSVGEEEFDEINEKILSCKKYVLVIGSDVFNHPRAKNIAKILGMISKYSDFEILMIPSELNTLGVSLICDLDETSV